MDFSWLSDLWNAIKGIFRKLLKIRPSEIWRELVNLYARVRRWLEWYRNNVHNHIQAMQQMRRQIYDTFFKPILTIIDTIRRAATVVGLISPKLASKLNSLFLRIEDRILRPFQLLTDRFNLVAGVLRSTLTPLGYLDRPTLLNSLWRDVRSLRAIMRNPLGGTIATGPAPTTISPQDKVANIDAYFTDASGPIAASVAAKRSTLDTFFAGPR